MTDEQISQLSALVDGELAGRNALGLYDSVERDPALRAAWERYHLIGQVLRGERVQRDRRAQHSRSAGSWVRSGSSCSGFFTKPARANT